MRRRVLVCMLALVSVVTVSAPSAPAQESLRKVDRQGPVTVSVTLLAPLATGSAIKAKIGLDTHSVDLDGVAFESAVSLRRADGADVAPTAVEQVTGGGHHRQAVLVFPPVPDDGPVRIVVKGAGGVSERVFAWERPTGR